LLVKLCVLINNCLHGSVSHYLQEAIPTAIAAHKCNLEDAQKSPGCPLSRQLSKYFI